MADNDDKIKISELDPALQLDNTSETVINKKVSGNWVTFKMTIATLAAHILEVFASSSLRTTNKTVVGAINELQQGGGGGGSSTLAGLTDVNLTSPTNNQILKYDSASGKWINGTGGGGGASALTDLSDVDISNLVNNQILKYNSETQKWENRNINTYSTSEKIAGTWVDGSTVYEKTFVINTPSGGLNTITHNISNLGEVVNLEGAAIRSNGAVQPLGFISAANNYGWNTTIYDFTSSNFSLEVGSQLSLSKVIVTARYTKSST